MALHSNINKAFLFVVVILLTISEVFAQKSDDLKLSFVGQNYYGLFAGFAIKAHSFDAEYFEFSLGIRFLSK